MMKSVVKFCELNDESRVGDVLVWDVLEFEACTFET